MFKNYLKIALRNFVKNKVYSIITVLGLSIGITCCLLIMLYVKQELSYDRFYPNADHIYRVATKIVQPQGTGYTAATPTPLGPALKKEYPEIQHITRVYFDDQALFKYGNKRIFENKVIYADPGFFKVFPFPLLKGSRAHLLDSPDSMVLTASLAQKYFGDESPIGKIIQVNNQYNFKVTGVVKDVPVNSHFHFDAVISFLAKNEKNFGTWLNLWTGFTNLYTYAVLPGNVNINEFSNKVENIITRHSKKRRHIERKIFFQPLKRIHLFSHIQGEIEANNNAVYLVILTAIAFLILIIACINYMNLANAQSLVRAKEVGMRKVLGAARFHLVKQFMGESMMFTVLSMFVSLVLVEVFLPLFSSSIGKPVNFIFRENLFFLAGFFLISLFIGALAGIYPAVFLSRHQPIKTLKGLKNEGRTSKGHHFFKKSLVVGQFVVSILLIICTLIINQQLHYMKNADLGFDKEHTVLIQLLNKSGQKQYQTVKNELMEHPGVIGASACLRAPLLWYNIVVRAFPKGRDAEENFIVNLNFVDYDFIDHFKIKMAAGRNFSPKYTSDLKGAFIINEATVRKWGFASPDEALGKTLVTSFNLKGTIIGVIEDHHMRSLHKEIEPQIMIYNPEYFVSMAVKIKPGNIPATLAAIEKTYNKFIPEYPFTYSFLDEYTQRYYRGEETTARIVSTFSIIAISIACLGLFGLAAFSVQGRTKEIGIRKTLGATVSNIVFSLSTEFTNWVLLANLAAWPTAYYIMNKWLQGFAYHIDIGIYTFLGAAGLAFIIALLTVSYQAIKAATANPVEALRHE